MNRIYLSIDNSTFLFLSLVIVQQPIVAIRLSPSDEEVRPSCTSIRVTSPLWGFRQVPTARPLAPVRWGLV